MKKSKVDLVKNWMEKERWDLVTAQNGFAYAETFTDIICFHSKQAGEKYIKAYLVWHEINFPKTHSLEDLILLATQQEPSFLALHKHSESANSLRRRNSLWGIRSTFRRRCESGNRDCSTNKGFYPGQAPR